MVRKFSYTDKIKAKIRQLSDAYAEDRFMDLIKSKRINTEVNWTLSKEIVPGRTASSIGNSLYEKEAAMNNFEERVAMELGTSSNIVFWHRNLERGKGFYINGFKANHYPDFIMQILCRQNRARPFWWRPKAITWTMPTAPQNADLEMNGKGRLVATSPIL